MKKFIPIAVTVVVINLLFYYLPQKNEAVHKTDSNTHTPASSMVAHDKGGSVSQMPVGSKPEQFVSESNVR